MGDSARKRTRRKDDLTLKLKKVDAVTAVALGSVRLLTTGVVVWGAVRIAEALAGQLTVADIGIVLRLLDWPPLSVALGWMVGIGGAVYGYAQGQMRRSTIEKVHQQIRDYEKLLDPGRSSSSLTARGETPKEDQP